MLRIEEPCPSCEAEDALEYDRRVQVGGRTLIRCVSCGAHMVDENDEPQSMKGTAIVRGNV